MMNQSNYRTPRFWTELRRRTTLDGRIGIEECSVWCEQALELLTNYQIRGFKKVEGFVSTKMVGKYGLFVNTHRALAQRSPEGIFIADGTAGQIDKRYPQGFYGYVSEAPELLRLFYDPALRRWG